MYDLYMYYNGSAIQFDTPVQWSSPTTIPTHTVINGVSLNPANTTRRLVCSFYAIGNNLTCDFPGGHCICNQQNRKTRTVSASNQANWTYSGSTRPANGLSNSFANVGVGYVWFVSSDGTNVANLSSYSQVSIAGGSTIGGIGTGLTSAGNYQTGASVISCQSSAIACTMTNAATYELAPGFTSVNQYESTIAGSVQFFGTTITGTVEN
jgi:hypothetical protein